MNDRILSIITNFGCDTGCKYCIWKGHSLSDIKTTNENTDWDKLQREIEICSPKQISVSGGGDPLFKYKENRKWWDSLFDICGDNTKVELHTSKLVPEWEHVNKLNRYVLHLEADYFSSHAEDLKEFAKETPLRLVLVLNHKVSLKIYLYIALFCKTNDIELSLRQLVLNGKEQYILHDYMKFGHEQKYWYYIEQADYNSYYMPDNKVYVNYQF